MSTTKQEKEDLREKVLSKRATLSKTEWMKKSESIISKIMSLDELKNADTVHCYVSLNERREVQTDNLINTLLKSGKKVVVPITNFSTGTLSHSYITSLSDLKANKWGVREPENPVKADIDNFDFIIIPMAAADVKGNRLGYGKGFYDHFLAQVSALKVGVVFNEFIFDEIPTESFDEKLDIIISEETVISP